MSFPPELDDFLDSCAHARDFDFQAVSEELLASAVDLLRHPHVDEPDDLVLERAEEVFSPSALRARWELSNCGWEAVSFPKSDDWVLLSQHSSSAAAESQLMAKQEPGEADLGALFLSLGATAHEAKALGFEDLGESPDSDSEEERIFMSRQRLQMKLARVRPPQQVIRAS